jgi:hypothetical protein
MKPKGYILFAYYSKCQGFSNGIDISDHFTNIEDLMQSYHNHWDDKWDVEDRNKIDYFYLDLGHNEYIPLSKWKNPYNPKDGCDTDTETIMSKKYFVIE